MAKKIYVGNLSFSVNDEELQQAFASFGAVVSARIVIDKMSGRSKGFGFVEMESDSAADEAVDKMNGQEIAGRPVRVSEAKPQEDRPRREGGGFGGGGGRGPRREGGGGGGYRGNRDSGGGSGNYGGGGNY